MTQPVDSRPHILAATRQEVLERLANWGEPAYRAGQLLDWIYARRVGSWDEMTNLSRALRERLNREYDFRRLELVTTTGAGDTTVKFLWRLADGALIESVLIPANPALYGEASDRQTLCVSTQVGCAYGCRFCASGLDGWRRNLLPEEIVDQVLAVERWHVGRSKESKRNADGLPGARLINNLVIMGMGEPLANYANLLAALRLLNAPWGGNIGARKITVSTSGLVPQIRQLADEPEQFRLAISLHGATNEVRDRLMPVNRKYPIEQLTEACAHYLAKKGRMLTFEYILIKGVNDHVMHAQPLANMARRLHAKINLIPYNEVSGLSWRRPELSDQQAFLAAIERFGQRATLRFEKGSEIEAACGQLRLKHQSESNMET
jgi:23S rRNA (adenine2503-C2)-methyltransferase